MPELPEVETIKQGLKKVLIGHKINSIDVRVRKLFIGKEKLLVGQKIIDIERRAKLIIWKLSDLFLVTHLKMTGQLIFKAKLRNKKEKIITGGHPEKVYNQPLPHKYTHIIIEFDDGVLYFNDLRKFGWMKMIQTEQKLNELVAEYGPEYDWPEFNLDYFRTKINQYKNRTIKEILLDQSIIAGLGNIYSDEVLFCAKIYPKRKAGSLKEKELKSIFQCIPEILKSALKHGGTSLKDYIQPDGTLGTYFAVANVYQKEKKPCNMCHTLIKRVKIGSRSSYFCPKCQK